jgi:hypothetical protein
LVDWEQGQQFTSFTRKRELGEILIPKHNLWPRLDGPGIDPGRQEWALRVSSSGLKDGSWTTFDASISSSVSNIPQKKKKKL